MEKDRKGMESNVLRFLARFETTRPIDMDRRFIVSYFLSDDTMTVFEPPQRNSGIIGGKFLERGRLKKPEQEPEQTVQSTYYTAQDLFIGAVVQFNRHKFILINADEFAIRYMEKHAQDFPFSNWQLVLQQLKETATGKSEEMKTEFTKHDTEKTGLVPFDLFKRLMMQLTEGSLSQHEIITLGRHYSKQQEEPVEMQHFVESVRDQLRRQNFQRLSQLCVAFTRIDPENTGSIDKHNVRRICAEYDVPVREETLEELMQKCVHA
jgi:Ca2+-binding EF-hand superfamily protein